MTIENPYLKVIKYYEDNRPAHISEEEYQKILLNLKSYSASFEEHKDKKE